MTITATLGVDIGTSSSKGVLVDTGGNIIATATRAHDVSRPAFGLAEMEGGLWWDEFISLATELVNGRDIRVAAIGVSGMGPCVLLTDDAGDPLRPAILYGIDTRAIEQIARLTDEFGADAIYERCGSLLTTQAVGPKLAWIAQHEPDVAARARMLFMPASWLAYRLTGRYVLDFHSASQCTPLFDTQRLEWFEPWSDRIAPGLTLPELLWPGDEAGRTREVIAGIPAGTPVIAGTIDAWMEAVSVGATRPGDLMLMYGTTMFLIATTANLVKSRSMWATVGALPASRNLAGGMATSGAITSWLRELVGSPDYTTLIDEASAAGLGAHGLLMLPYFAGERTPVFDPLARGVIAGLTLSHTRGDLYRAALEATAFGVRHNIETIRQAGAPIARTIAVGGGTKGDIWTQIVSDAAGIEQEVPTKTIGASFGAAFLAAQLDTEADITQWNPPRLTIRPSESAQPEYDELYSLYRNLYPATQEISHALALRGTRVDTHTA